MNPAFVLLPIVLYLGGYFLDFEEIKKHKVSIILAITVGVAVKIIAVGLILQLFFPGATSWIIACIVGQIDPGATLFFRNFRPDSISIEYETLSGSMSAFDDPMTALIALLILPTMLGMPSQLQLTTYLTNLALVGILIVLTISLSSRVKTVAVSSFLVFSSFLQATVSAGLLGVFIKPDKITKHISFKTVAEKSIPVLFFISIILIVTSLNQIPNTTQIIHGVVAGVLMYGAQMIVGKVIGQLSQLSPQESNLFALDQFNGITSSTLALLFAPLVPEIVPITIAAMTTVGLLYLICNGLFKLHIDRNSIPDPS
jgi:hypothetical protein